MLRRETRLSRSPAKFQLPRLRKENIGSRSRRRTQPGEARLGDRRTSQLSKRSNDASSAWLSRGQNCRRSVVERSQENDDKGGHSHDALLQVDVASMDEWK